jgi:hypothetical protein
MGVSPMIAIRRDFDRYSGRISTSASFFSKDTEDRFGRALTPEFQSAY